MIGININTKNNGIGKYAEDIARLIRVYTVIIDKQKRNAKCVGEKIDGFYPPVTNGWALNIRLFRLILKKNKLTQQNIHLLTPLKPPVKEGIVTIHDLYSFGGKNRMDKYFSKVYGMFENWKIITPTQIVKDELLHHYDYDPNQITVVPLSIDSSKFFRMGTSKKYDIITVGDGSHKNNHKVHKIVEDKEYSYVHVGNEAPESNRFMNVSNFNLNVLYNQSKVAIRYSDKEGFGIPAIESIFAGTPIILSRLPVFEEIMGEKYPLFVDTLDEIPDKIEEAEDFDFSYFSKKWYDNYSFSEFSRRMYHEYKMHREHKGGMND